MPKMQDITQTNDIRKLETTIGNKFLDTVFSLMQN